ncbi:MAG: response regulator [Lachnospiraceae bacterium]|nr:response regulator [Lachnospiraceae bacterium]
MISVLIADDEKLIRETLVHYIKWQEIGIDTVYEAADGVEAMTLIQEKKPDIIITDIKMPHMDGIKLAQIIRKDFPSMRLVFLSGHTDKEFLKAAIHLKADGYIEKPLNLKEITEMLREMTEECQKEQKKKHPNVYFYHENGDIAALNQDTYKLSRDTLQEFGHCLKTGTRHDTLKQMRSICSQIRKCEGTPPEYVRNMYSQLALQVENAAELRCAHNTQAESSRFVYEAANAPTLTVLENELQRITTLLFEEISSQDLNPVKLVNDYIRKNYMDSTLTIEQIARDLNFNTSYLCTIYKQRTGNTINTTLTSVRIEAARRLLVESDLKLYEVGTRVGYPNGKYFTKVFAKETGVSPRNYRGLHHESK